MADPGSHSLKSPCTHAQAGHAAETTVPSRNRVQLCDQKKKVLRLVGVVVPGNRNRPAKVIAKDIPLQRLLESVIRAGRNDLPVEEEIVGIHRIVANKLVGGAVKIFVPLFVAIWMDAPGRFPTSAP